jgi:two-component system chemotaxis sensor kinase CheA
MQPLGSIFGKFPRLIRDLSRSLNKEVELVLQGESVELDKSIIEALTDPLTHLLRNSVDHGIEDPATRKSRGKPQVGKVNLNAFHEGGQVVIEIRDDGGGINVAKVKEKAVAVGLLRKEDAEKLTEKDVFNLLLEPGFSTADTITDVSGRGVGMDVVKTNIENLSGSVDIASEQYKGMTITLRLPLTLAIIPALTLECHGRRFAVPQVSLNELVHLHAKDASRSVLKINGKDILRLRGMLLPLVNLSVLLHLKKEFVHPDTKEKMEDRRDAVADRRREPAETPDGDKRASTPDRRQSYASAYNIIVLKIGVNHFGLIVDKLLDTEEIVVKPLSGYLKNCRCYSGATIIGDGRVAMILDPGGIAEMAGLHFSELAEEEQRQTEQYKTQSTKESQRLLLFRNANAEYMALNLALIRRIETISRSNIETIGNKEYLKYKDYSMRVIKPSDFLPISVNPDKSENVYIIVPKLVAHPIGIIADVILDVIETSAEIDTGNITAPGIQGSVIIDGKLILILDIYSLFELADPDNYKHPGYDEILSGKRILLAEDTSFFRTIEYNYLTAAGCIVDAVKNGVEAVEHLGNATYDMVITDINMPEMDGFELTNHIRNTQALQHLPVVALTSMRDEKLEKECEESGLNAYEIKIDKGNLLKKLSALFQPVPEGS